LSCHSESTWGKNRTISTGEEGRVGRRGGEKEKMSVEWAERMREKENRQGREKRNG